MNKKRLKQLRENGRAGGIATAKKYGHSYFKEISKKAVDSNFKGMTKEQRSDKMRCVRMKQYGYFWNKEQKKCIKPKLGLAFADNITTKKN